MATATQTRKLALATACATTLLGLAGQTLATSGTWNSTADSDWNTPGNWSAGVPGSSDTATFKGSAKQTQVTLSSASSITSIVFDQLGANNAGSYTIGQATPNAGPVLTLANTGGTASVTVSSNLSTANTTERISATLALAGSYQFINSSPTASTTLVLNGNISSIAASGTTDVQLKGSNLGDNTVNGVISNGITGAAVSLTQLNGGNWIVAGENTYTGKTLVTGTLSVSTLNHIAAGSLGGASFATTPYTSSNLGAPTTVSNGTIGLGGTITPGQLTYKGSGETTDRVINLAGTTGGAVLDQSGTGALVFVGAGASAANAGAVTATGNGIKTLTLQGSTTGTGEIGGVIKNNTSSNTTSLVKNGSGKWTLSGANSTVNAGFTGTTTVNAGTLMLAHLNALGTTTGITVSGGTLASNVANANLGGALSLGSGAISPGDTAVGQLTLAANKNFSMTGGTWFNAIGATSDKIAGSGTSTFSITGGTLDLTGSTITYAQTYGILTGFSSGSVSGLAITGYDTVHYEASLSNAGVLSFSPVPEPASLTSLAIGALALLRRRRAV